MNRLSNEKRARILGLLSEGVGINAASRFSGAHKTTILSLLVEAGRFSRFYQGRRLRGLPCRRIEADEIWSFVGAKKRNARPGSGHGDLWTFTALCPDSKLMVAWRSGPRSQETAREMMLDLASRVSGRIQLTTDGHGIYEDAVREAFGHRIDYA